MYIAHMKPSSSCYRANDMPFHNNNFKCDFILIAYDLAIRRVYKKAACQQNRKNRFEWRRPAMAIIM